MCHNLKLQKMLEKPDGNKTDGVVLLTGSMSRCTDASQLPLILMSFRALKLCGSGGPPHVKLIIEWEHRIKDWSVHCASSCFSITLAFALTLTNSLCPQPLR